MKCEDCGLENKDHDFDKCPKCGGDSWIKILKKKVKKK